MLGRKIRPLAAFFAAMAMLGCKRSNDTAAASGSSDLTGSSRSGMVVESANDYGPHGTIDSLRTLWQKEAEPPDTISQVVVVGRYGVVEVRTGGPNSPFLVVFAHNQNGGWQDQGMITGPLAVCALTGQNIPEPVAREIVAHDVRLRATNAANPRAGCSGAI